MRWRWGAAVLAALCLAACNHHLYSPPARVLPLETAATLAPGRTSVGVDGNLAAVVFGADVLGGTARVRHGLVEGLEGSVEGSAHYVSNPASTDLHRGFYGGRLGVKYRVVKHFSVFSGLAGGGSAAGGFCYPDAGAVLAYENPYFVPFVAGGLGVSLPVGPRTIAIPDEDDDLSWEHPSTTYHGSGQLGFRIPIESGDGRLLSIYAALGFGYLRDREQDDAYAALGTGVELSL